MKILFTFKILLSLALFVFLGTAAVQAQDSDPFEEISTAMKSGNAKYLTTVANETLEIGFDGDNAGYSKTQAEFVLKDFFRNNKPDDFEYVHKGASGRNVKYAVGKLSCRRSSYRTVLYLKSVKGKYLIDKINFTKE